MENLPATLIERVRAAAADGTPLRIRGGGSKDFYGGLLVGEVLDTRVFAGIVEYEPSELVITARGGTPLAELEELLEAHQQMLAFEPPHFGPGATVGGSVAAGLAGPRRASAGGVRDFVLGTTLLDGRAQTLRFGGRVMKNVAGYDVSRLLAGSFGMFGVIVEVSLKVLPRPAREITLAFDFDEATAITAFNRWSARPLPISATAWCSGRAWLRLSGSEPAVADAVRTLGGEQIEEAQAGAWWRDAREQRHTFFAQTGPLWRLSMPATADPLALGGAQFMEWGGAQRWLRDTTLPAAAIRAAVTAVGGHATLFRGGDRTAGVFTRLAPVNQRIHEGLKQVFDPAGIFCRSRMYPEF